MRVAVMGAGCVGSVIASRLQATGCDIALIAIGERGARLQRGGLEVNGVHHSFAVLGAEQSSGPYPDLVIVCVKNYQLDDACEDMRDFIGGDTVLLPLLNSISPVPIIREHYPFNEVLYGYISKIDSHRDGEGFCYNVAGDIHFGRAENNDWDELLDSISRMFLRAGFCVDVDEDMMRGIWKKWMLNVGANQVSALTEANYLQFARIPEIEVALRMAMNELVVLASKENVNLMQADVDELIEYLMTYPYPKQTSMLQDVLAHRKTEIEAISGEILRLSAKWDQPCPVNKTMFNLIRAKERAYMMKEEGNERNR